MRTTDAISNTQDYIDSRDVVARIEHLTAEWEEAAEDTASDYSLSEDDWAVYLGADDAAELVALLALNEEGESYSEDWSYGATLIHEDTFVSYAQELAEDIGAIDRDASWPLMHIDWEAAADALKVDYNEVEFAGQTYYVR